MALGYAALRTADPTYDSALDFERQGSGKRSAPLQLPQDGAVRANALPHSAIALRPGREGV